MYCTDVVAKSFLRYVNAIARVLSWPRRKRNQPCFRVVFAYQSVCGSEELKRNLPQKARRCPTLKFRFVSVQISKRRSRSGEGDLGDKRPIIISSKPQSKMTKIAQFRKDPTTGGLGRVSPESVS